MPHGTAEGGPDLISIDVSCSQPITWSLERPGGMSQVSQRWLAERDVVITDCNFVFQWVDQVSEGSNRVEVTNWDLELERMEKYRATTGFALKEIVISFELRVE